MKPFKVIFESVSNFRMMLDLKIVRNGDLAPKGIKSSYGKSHGFKETFEHIFKEANKPDPSWGNLGKKQS